MTKNTLNKKVNRVIYMLQDIKDALCNNNCEYCSFYTGVRDSTKLNKKNCLFVINTENLLKQKRSINTVSITKSYYPPVVNEKEKDMYYKGYYIFRNIRGMYASFLKYKGYYVQSDTFKELKALIREDKEQAELFTCH